MTEYDFTFGTNIYDLFIIPAIRLHHNDGFGNYLTVEWLKWYVGVKWFEYDD